MAEYWLKASPDAPVNGPITAAEVKRRAATGEIARTTLISMDQATWHPAGRVRGVFAAMAPAAVETVPSARWDQPVQSNGDGEADAADAPAEQASPTSARAAAQRPAPRPVPPVYPGMERRHVASSAVAEVGTGKIETQPPMPVPPITNSEATAAEVTTPTSPPPLPMPAGHAPLSYATPRGMDARSRLGTPLRPRKTRAFFSLAILMIPVGLFHAFEWYVSFTESGSGQHDFLRFLVCGAWVALVIPAFVMWIKWLGAAHRDARAITGYRYPISPARATGFMFIPFFNAFWAIFMPGKLAGAVNEALEAAGQPKISSGAVTACQVASVIAPLVGLYALTPLLCAISMRTIQGGFNRLAANQYAAAA